MPVLAQPKARQCCRQAPSAEGECSYPTAGAFLDCKSYSAGLEKVAVTPMEGRWGRFPSQPDLPFTLEL